MWFILVLLLISMTTRIAVASSQQTGIVSTNGGNLNVREGPSTQNKILLILKDKTQITILEESGEWYKIQFQNTKGYASKKYVDLQKKKSFIEARVDENGTVPLKLRTGPSTAHSILQKIPRGSKIYILGNASTSWYKAAYKGITGYVHKSYIVIPKNLEVNDTGTKEKEQKKDILLDVPVYHQRDEKWKNISLGDSGVTIGKSGCTVSCLAASEQFLKKKTITPKTIAQTADFTSDGCIYWLDGYVPYKHTDMQKNLQKIYELLQQGKPVLYGGFTPSHKQHWVLVIGYTENGEKLSAKDFIIMDPMNRHETLAEYTEKYSVFYKLMYCSDN